MKTRFRVCARQCEIRNDRPGELEEINRLEQELSGPSSVLPRHPLINDVCKALEHDDADHKKLHYAGSGKYALHFVVLQK